MVSKSNFWRLAWNKHRSNKQKMEKKILLRKQSEKNIRRIVGITIEII
jgi:hypothetical protein